MADESSELFTRLGGTETLTSVVRDMYERVFADEELGHFFEGVEKDRLASMQFHFLASAFGGPVKYSGGELTDIHRPLKISSQHFAKFCGHFADALEASGATPRDVDDALGRLAIYKDKITGESNVDG